MAHYVGKILHIRPLEILKTWSCAELVVAFGKYANEKSKEAYDIWRSGKPGERRGERPSEYVVKFYSEDMLNKMESK